MAGKVCKVYLVRPREAWYQLSREEQDALFAKVGDALASVGGKPIVRCESYWGSEQWPYFGVEEFPDVEAVQELARLHDELNWGRYIDAFTILGTPIAGPA